ncbi:MAG TPA: dihydroorotase [Bacteroidales bacterium]|nr:dihydroorotase [Bacteroidales bacterium]
MSDTLIRNATIINEGHSYKGDILIRGEIIGSIGRPGTISSEGVSEEIDAEGLFLIPGVIDVHVHFREPGLTQKGDIASESRAAVAGGVTSFMDMPNTIPQTVTLKALNEKFTLGSEKSFINYSFYIGATNNNLDEILKADPSAVSGIKLFLGSSTGNMLVNETLSLSELFKRAHLPVCAHCEDDAEIKKNSIVYREKYGENVPFEMHPLIRSREACFMSSSSAVKMAREYNTRLHITHLSTADEMKLFSNEEPAGEKRITGEACVHHLWFDDSFYEKSGAFIKWNPAIKTRFDRESLTDAVNKDLLDVISTDHAPHSLKEKTGTYFNVPSGAPMVQHSLVTMFEMWHRRLFTPEKIIEKMCHNPAVIFNIEGRGFIREGYKADLVLVDPDKTWTVSRENILYKCGWSPLVGTTFNTAVIRTFVNGTTVYNNGVFNEDYRGQRLKFDR